MREEWEGGEGRGTGNGGRRACGPGNGHTGVASLLLPDTYVPPFIWWGWGVLRGMQDLSSLTRD